MLDNVFIKLSDYFSKKPSVSNFFEKLFASLVILFILIIIYLYITDKITTGQFMALTGNPAAPIIIVKENIENNKANNKV